MTGFCINNFKNPKKILNSASNDKQKQAKQLNTGCLVGRPMSHWRVQLISIGKKKKKKKKRINCM